MRRDLDVRRGDVDDVLAFAPGNQIESDWSDHGAGGRVREDETKAQGIAGSNRGPGADQLRVHRVRRRMGRQPGRAGWDPREREGGKGRKDEGEDDQRSCQRPSRDPPGRSGHPTGAAVGRGFAWRVPNVVVRAHQQRQQDDRVVEHVQLHPGEDELHDARGGGGSEQVLPQDGLTEQEGVLEVVPDLDDEGGRPPIPRPPAKGWPEEGQPDQDRRVVREVEPLGRDENREHEPQRPPCLRRRPPQHVDLDRLQDMLRPVPENDDQEDEDCRGVPATVQCRQQPAKPSGREGVGADHSHCGSPPDQWSTSMALSPFEEPGGSRRESDPSPSRTPPPWTWAGTGTDRWG